jgi:hypothetical protein
MNVCAFGPKEIEMLTAPARSDGVSIWQAGAAPLEFNQRFLALFAVNV